MRKEHPLDKIVVISALNAESKTLQAYAGQLNLQTTGMGSTAVNECLAKLNTDTITGLISWGVCGGLSRDLSAGDLIIPKSIVNQQKQCIDCDTGWHQAIQHALGHEDAVFFDSMMVNSEFIIETSQDKQDLFAQSHADAVDMESFAVAMFANRHQLPFIVIRAVVDTVDDTLPSATRFETGQSDTSLATIMNALAHPWQWPALIRTGRQFNRALNSLNKSSRQIIDLLVPGNKPHTSQ